MLFPPSPPNQRASDWHIAVHAPGLIVSSRFDVSPAAEPSAPSLSKTRRPGGRSARASRQRRAKLKACSTKWGGSGYWSRGWRKKDWGEWVSKRPGGVGRECNMTSSECTNSPAPSHRLSSCLQMGCLAVCPKPAAAACADPTNQPMTAMRCDDTEVSQRATARQGHGGMQLNCNVDMIQGAAAHSVTPPESGRLADGGQYREEGQQRVPVP